MILDLIIYLRLISLLCNIMISFLKRIKRIEPYTNYFDLIVIILLIIRLKINYINSF